MLTRALATFELELENGRQLMVDKDELIDLPGGLAVKAIAQGAARAADISEASEPSSDQEEAPFRGSRQSRWRPSAKEE